MKTYDVTIQKLSDQDKAFMDSFNYTHEQYGISDENIIAFLTGNTNEYYEGYTQLADAHNLWEHAIAFARSEK